VFKWRPLRLIRVLIWRFRHSFETKKQKFHFFARIYFLQSRLHEKSVMPSAIWWWNCCFRQSSNRQLLITKQFNKFEMVYYILMIRHVIICFEGANFPFQNRRCLIESGDAKAQIRCQPATASRRNKMQVVLHSFWQTQCLEICGTQLVFTVCQFVLGTRLIRASLFFKH
jgi:hypothetical protein